jgi:hypothetical protein
LAFLAPESILGEGVDASLKAKCDRGIFSGFAVVRGTSRLWVKSVSHARSETDKQNIEGHHPPNEMAGIAATFFLVAAGTIAAIPRREMAGRRLK